MINHIDEDPRFAADDRGFVEFEDGSLRDEDFGGWSTHAYIADLKAALHTAAESNQELQHKAAYHQREVEWCRAEIDQLVVEKSAAETALSALQRHLPEAQASEQVALFENAMATAEAEDGKVGAPAIKVGWKDLFDAVAQFLVSVLQKILASWAAIIEAAEARNHQIA